MLLAVAALFGVAKAQQTTTVVEEVDVVELQDKYQVVTNRFWDNWFLSFGGGASVLLGDDDSAGSFGKRISPTLNIAVGKWFTPGLGLRLQYSGLQARGFSYDATAPYVRGSQRMGGYYKQRFDYMNLHGDVLFNLNALFGGYNAHRVYEIVPYLGAGFTYNYTSPHRKAFALNAGIINKFRLSNAVDLNLELSAMGVEDKFDGQVGGDHGYDGLLSASVGLTYRFPTRGFKRPAPQLISQLELAAMQASIAELAAANQQLAEDLRMAENAPVAEVTEVAEVVVPMDIAPRTVFFSIGSAELSPREIMDLSYLAKHMQEFPETTFTVNGYADSATGSVSFNQELSRKRAQSVVDILVKQYGIAPERLTINAEGGVDTFGQPILNRVVLVKSAE